MCRAGKDGRYRICPANNHPEKLKERDARRRLAYMKKSMKQRISNFKAELERREQEGAPVAGKALDELKKEMLFKPTDLLYQRHLEYAHVAISNLRKMKMETHLVYAGKTSGGDLKWTADREKIHNEIIREQLAAWENVPRNAEAIFSGGLGGAGKSTVLKAYANIDLKQYATLNPDDIKEVMAAKGLVPEVSGLTPMEASPLIHEEASHITKQLAMVAMHRKMNIIYDITMADYGSTKKKVDNLRNSGYEQIDAIFVDISEETSDERADARHLRGHNRYLSGEGFGGRLLPKGISAAQVPEDPEYRSLNAENFLKLKEDGVFRNTVAYDNNRAGEEPIKLDSLKTVTNPPTLVPSSV